MPQVFFSLVIVLIALKKTEIQFFGIMFKYLSLRNISINTKTFSTFFVCFSVQRSYREFIV